VAVNHDGVTGRTQASTFGPDDRPEATAGVDAGRTGAMLARDAAHHTSPDWFRTLGALLDVDRFLTVTDRVAARRSIELLLRDDWMVNRRSSP
jgi:hypothetical protein